MMKKMPMVLGLLLLPALAACGQGAGTDEAAPVAPSADVTANPVVATSPAPAPVAAALRTSPGPGGSTVELTRVQVTGAIMTVELRFVPQPDKSMSQWYFNVNDVSIIDDVTSQRYSVLKDEQDKWMAAPLSGGRIGVTTSKGESAIIWLKFPAPPASSATVSLNFPDVSPFDGVPVQR